MQRWDRTRRSFREAHEFVRKYAGGVRSSDLQRLFEREAPDIYPVLTRDLEPPVERRGLRRFLHHATRFFLGLSYQLSPLRRILFAAALVMAVAGSFEADLGGDRVGITLSAEYLLSIALLVLLLALELVDRIRVRDELEVARELQRELLPQEPPSVPGYRCAFAYRTANEIGGDYYDLRHVADGRVAVVAGDASGHGIAAGLVMVIAHSTLGLALDLDPSPRAVADLLNRVLARTGGPRAFMTLFYGLLDPDSGRMEYVCAGHPFPLLRRADGTIEELGQGALPVGLRPGLAVTPQEVRLSPGDLLLIYSDGLPEALSARRDESFGFSRIPGLLAVGGTPEEVRERVLAELERFLHGEIPGDDVSLVVLGRDA